LWITHRLEELDLCDGAARMEEGRLGAWQSAAELRASLPPLLGGRAER
jgi:energy-coupling factor transport system ATP-binding protein